MSLVGNLEDLALGEILQIVSLSRKSGVLSLHSRGREGRIVFRSGQVTCAHSSTWQQGLGEVLIQKGIIDLPKLKVALAAQERNGFTERLGAILVRDFGIPQHEIEDVAREQVEKVIYSLFVWSDGTFDFELQDTADIADQTKLDALQFMLDQGLNPQYLAMEGSRIIDEQRHQGGGLDDDHAASDANVDFAFDMLQSSEPAAEPPAPPAPEPPPVLPTAPAPAPEEPAAGRPDAVVVDDDPSVLAAMTRILGKAGYEVSTFEKSEDTLIAIDSLYRSGRSPVVVVDLVMPRMDGSGTLGGLELLKFLHNNFSSVRVVVVSDFQNAEAQRKVAEMRYPFLLKPAGDQLSDLLVLDDFAGKLLPLLSGEKAPSPSLQKVNIGDDLRMEFGEAAVPSSGPVVPSTGISLLRSMLEELNNPSLGGGIILLVLRFASEFMNRGVIFLVKKQEIVGLGQFGMDEAEGGGDAWVRSMRIPKDEDSMFARVLDAQAAMKMQPDGSHWNRYVIEQFGGETPREVFLGPLVSEGKVVAVLYGDNLPEQKAIGDTESLEIFLSQAGLAMEKAILQRRLKEKGQEGA